MDNDTTGYFKTVEGIFSEGKLYTKSDLNVAIYRSFKREHKYIEGYFNLKWSKALNTWILFQYVEERMPHLKQWYFDITGRIGR